MSGQLNAFIEQPDVMFLGFKDRNCADLAEHNLAYNILHYIHMSSFLYIPIPTRAEAIEYLEKWTLSHVVGFLIVATTVRSGNLAVACCCCVYMRLYQDIARVPGGGP